MTIPRPSADAIISAVTRLQVGETHAANAGLRTKPDGQAKGRQIAAVIRWLDDQAELASEEELDAQRQTGLGPDGERLVTPYDADDD